MVRLFLFIFLAQVTLAVFALISCLSADGAEIRALPRLVWVLIILFFPLIGSIAWFLAGRPVPADKPAGTWRVGSGFPEHQRPVAPDDDPEFLRSLDGEKARQDRELFQKWEDDLRRREDKQPGRDTEGPREDV